ncbi:MAG: amino acid permease, partial [archaeon]|nr:amino acid permease [archaeon]
MSSINNESTENKVENKEGKLKRELGLFQVVMFIFGYVVGAGILVQAGSAAAYTGPSLWIAFIVAGIPNLLGTLILIKLIEDIPVSGGFWVYSSRLGGPLVGFFAMISIVFHLVGSLALMAVGFGEYFEYYIPDSALIIGICILLVFFIINVLGIKIAIRVQVVLAIVGDFLVIFLFIIFGLPLVNSGNLIGAGGDGLFPNGFVGTFMGAVILSFSYAGFSAVAEIGGEVKNPKRNIPLGIIISFILVTTVYILISIVMIGVMDWEELGAGGTFIDVGQNIFPAFILNFLNILILIAIASTIHGILLAFSRDLFAAARDKMIPEIFSKINKKYNTPHFSIAFFSIGAICLTFFMQ